MGKWTGKEKEIALGDFNAVRVTTTDGTVYTLRQNESGGLLVVSNGKVDIAKPAPKIAPPKTATAMRAALQTEDIGRLIAGEGVYFGIWTPHDRVGIPLGGTWDMFTDTKDFTFATCGQAAKEVAGIRNLHGHDGAFFEDDSALHHAFRTGSYDGAWFPPTRELLQGIDLDGDAVQPDNLFAHRHKGVLAGTFNVARNATDRAHCYASCTALSAVPSGVYIADFADGSGTWTDRDDEYVSSRVVRAKLRL